MDGNIQLLVVKLGTREAMTARRCLLALARTQRLEVINTLVAVLRESVNDRARCDAALVLGEIPALLPLSAVAALEQASFGSNRELVENAQAALRHITQEAVAVFTTACATADVNNRRRAALVLNAVGRYVAEERAKSASGLAAALRSRDQVIRCAAQRAIAFSLA